jgi:hypothetical protein
MRPIEVDDIVELKPGTNLQQYGNGILSTNPRNNQSNMGSVIAIQDGQAEVQNGDVSTWYPLNILRIYQPENNSNSNINMNGGRRRRQTRRRKSKKRRYSRRR